jgi:hypothetical protein
MDHAIRVLHALWDMPRHQAADTLGATALEMRAAGCSAAEVMAARPRDVLRALPPEPGVWATAALTMADGGHNDASIASHLVAHAPTDTAFARALAAAIAQPADGIAHAVRYGAQAGHLTAAAHAYDLEPADAALALLDAGAPAQVTVETIHALCADDLAATAAVLEPVLGIDAERVGQMLTNPATRGAEPPMPDSPDPTDTMSLLAQLPAPEPSNDLTPDGLLALLPEPDRADLPLPTPAP